MHVRNRTQGEYPFICDRKKPSRGEGLGRCICLALMPFLLAAILWKASAHLVIQGLLAVAAALDFGRYRVVCLPPH